LLSGANFLVSVAILDRSHHQALTQPEGSRLTRIDGRRSLAAGY
jgi:hypothetical protein